MNREKEVPTRSAIAQFVEEQVALKQEEERRKPGPPKEVAERVKEKSKASRFLKKGDVKRAFPMLTEEEEEKILLDISSYEEKDTSFPLRYV